MDFSTKDSLSSNNSRKLAKGTAEVMWFVGKLSVDKFPASLGLLNLRGDALQYRQTATTLASISDVVFMFCDGDTLTDYCYKNVLQETAEKLKLKCEGEKKKSKLVVLFTKDAKRNVKENRAWYFQSCYLGKGGQ